MFSYGSGFDRGLITKDKLVDDTIKPFGTLLTAYLAGQCANGYRWGKATFDADEIQELLAIWLYNLKIMCLGVEYPDGLFLLFNQTNREAFVTALLDAKIVQVCSESLFVLPCKHRIRSPLPPNPPPPGRPPECTHSIVVLSKDLHRLH